MTLFPPLYLLDAHSKPKLSVILPFFFLSFFCRETFVSSLRFSIRLCVILLSNPVLSINELDARAAGSFAFHVLFFFRTFFLLRRLGSFFVCPWFAAPREVPLTFGTPHHFPLRKFGLPGCPFGGSNRVSARAPAPPLLYALEQELEVSGRMWPLPYVPS